MSRVFSSNQGLGFGQQTMWTRSKEKPGKRYVKFFKNAPALDPPLQLSFFVTSPWQWMSCICK